MFVACADWAWLTRVTARSTSFQKKENPRPNLSDGHVTANLHIKRPRRQRGDVRRLTALLVLGSTQSCSGLTIISIIIMCEKIFGGYVGPRAQTWERPPQVPTEELDPHAEADTEGLWADVSLHSASACGQWWSPSSNHLKKTLNKWKQASGITAS